MMTARPTQQQNTRRNPSLRVSGEGSEAWQQAAMCSGKTEIFFAPPGERNGRRRRREALARAYCACCTVAEQCRDAGRAGREHGLWGGENDEQRAEAGYGPRSPHRRAIAAAARRARESGLDADAFDDIDFDLDYHDATEVA